MNHMNQLKKGKSNMYSTKDVAYYLGISPEKVRRLRKIFRIYMQSAHYANPHYLYNYNDICFLNKMIQAHNRTHITYTKLEALYGHKRVNSAFITGGEDACTLDIFAEHNQDDEQSENEVTKNEDYIGYQDGEQFQPKQNERLRKHIWRSIFRK